MRFIDSKPLKEFVIEFSEKSLYTRGFDFYEDGNLKLRLRVANQRNFNNKPEDFWYCLDKDISHKDFKYCIPDKLYHFEEVLFKKGSKTELEKRSDILLYFAIIWSESIRFLSINVEIIK